MTGVRFLFRVTLRRHDLAAEIWHIKEPQKLPPVLSPGLRLKASRLSPTKGDDTAPMKAPLVNSWYDSYLGAVVLVRLIDGFLRRGMRIRMMGANAAYDVDRIGVFRPKMTETTELGRGEIGYITNPRRCNRARFRGSLDLNTAVCRPLVRPAATYPAFVREGANCYKCIARSDQRS
jgi:hypothetical protein